VQPTRITKKQECQRGFTLLEILIVIALVAMVSAIAIPSLGVGLKVNIDAASRNLASIVRTTRDEAVLKGQIYRVAFDIEKGQYWAEIGDRSFLMRTSEQEEEERRRKERYGTADEKDNEKAQRRDDGFSMAASIKKKKQSLPTGIKFVDLINSRTKEPQTSGIVYAHVFPHGFVEKLIIHVKDSLDRQATLVVDSVSGKSRVFNRYVKESEI